MAVSPICGPLFFLSFLNLPGRLRRVRIRDRRRWILQSAGINLTGWLGWIGIWSPDGLPVIARMPIVDALQRTLNPLYTPVGIVSVTIFVAFIKPSFTYRVTFPYRPCLGESAKRTKKRKRQSRERDNRRQFDFNHQANPWLLRQRRPVWCLFKPPLRNGGIPSTYRRVQARRVPRSGDA
jgi:hypothetical protein